MEKFHEGGFSCSRLSFNPQEPSVLAELCRVKPVQQCRLLQEPQASLSMGFFYVLSAGPELIEAQALYDVFSELLDFTFRF